MNNNSELFYGNCELCGREGRKIERQLTKGVGSYYRCYECNEKESFKAAYVSQARKAELEQTLIPEYLDYLRGLTDYYLKPLFYKRQPNEVALNKLWSRYIAAQYPKMKRILDVSMEDVPEF